MTRTVFLVAGLLLTAIPGFCNPPELRALEREERFLASQQYDSAMIGLRTALQRNPDDLGALYLTVAVRQSQILDYEAYMLCGKAFLSFADSVASILRKHLKTVRGADSVACLFYLGNTIGGKGLMLAKMGSWLPAAQCALESSSLLNQVVKMDPQFLNAYLGIGIFKYYLSANLRWMPVMGRRMDEGLTNIMTATNSSYPYCLAAKNSLCWILIDLNQYSRADSIASAVLHTNPDNTIFLRIKAYTACAQQNLDDAIRLAYRLIEVSKGRNPVNWPDMITGYCILTKCYDYRQNKTEVLRISKEAIDLPIPSPENQMSYVLINTQEIRAIQAKYGK